MNASLYLRVSTREQTTENQERELRSWATRLGLEVVAVYAETGSGARADRAQLGELLTAAHQRRFDTLLIWALDRLSREGIGALARYMEQLRAAGVRVLSHQEPWVDTAGPVSDLLVAIFAWVARQERERIGERVRAGQARARAQGRRLGRPRRGPGAAHQGRKLSQDRPRTPNPYLDPSAVCQNPTRELRHALTQDRFRPEFTPSPPRPRSS